MAEIKYTNQQTEELLKNKYVKSCTNKNISFTKECKIEVIKQSNNWIFYKDIFKNFWFPEYIINSEIPRNSLNRWKKNIKKWELELKNWRPKKEKVDFNNMTLEQENEYLRAENAYLKELKKLLDWNYP